MDDRKYLGGMLIEKLLEADAGFKEAFNNHRECVKKLSRLLKRPHPTHVEAMEKDRLKKLKLSYKDEMQRKFAQLRAV
ncbi:MAG: DUF465 domain-containing protein [Deltaproteobacteria bacterium]|nr:DUF465 domain-containing protein [Deltaproteobacteria bacterium]